MMMMMKRTFLLWLLPVMLFAAGSARALQNAAGEIEVLHIRGPVYLLAGAGGNITLSAGPDGVLMVDTGTEEMSGKVLGAIQELQKQMAAASRPLFPGFGSENRSELQALRATAAPPKPLRYILLTHFDPEHTGGNERLAASGKTITGGNVAGNIADATEGAAVVAHENVLIRMSDRSNKPLIPSGALPREAYFEAFYKLSHHFNGEGIQLIHRPAAHTDGDSIVWFRGSDVISTGDIFTTTAYPVIDIARGGSINGVIDSLNYILDLAFSEFRTEGGTIIVPGHGRLCDSADVAYYRDMVTVIRDRIQDMINKRWTLDQVKMARPTKDYDPRYGADTGPWTTAMFVEAVYQSLKEKQGATQ
jgi:cyclase